MDISKPIGYEPSEIDLPIGTLKKFTGNDKFFSRLCNENPNNMEAMFKLVLVCNKIPEFPPSIDHVMERKMEVIKFQSDFKNESDNKRKMDESEEINKRSKN